MQFKCEGQLFFLDRGVSKHLGSMEGAVQLVAGVPFQEDYAFGTICWFIDCTAPFRV